jgi:pimeloyl-ACP methyl ester carboxylesterase
MMPFETEYNYRRHAFLFSSDAHLEISHQRRRSMVARSALGLFVLLFTVTAASAQNLGSALRTERVEFEVTVTDGGPPYQATIVGYLYYLGTLENRPLQVVVHGATYNHSYWDFPDVNNHPYSYARFMAHRGYAVLAIDQLGAGESTKPADVSMSGTVTALHGVLQQLRSDANPIGHGFENIVLVGHSAGSANAVLLESLFPADADALVITAFRHLPLPVPPDLLNLALTLAGLPGAYFYIPEPYRTVLFYYPPAADPAVIQLDRDTQDQWTEGQLFTTFFSFFVPALTGVANVTGPVLIQLGEFDALFPWTNPEAELTHWTSTTPDMQLLAGLGHDFNLHLRNEDSWQGIDRWLKSVLEK